MVQIIPKYPLISVEYIGEKSKSYTRPIRMISIKEGNIHKPAIPIGIIIIHRPCITEMTKIISMMIRKKSLLSILNFSNSYCLYR